MKTFKKRFFAVLLSVYMVFGVVSTDYLSVQAFEWIVPQLSFSEALPFLLGALGVFAEVEKSESGYYDYSGLENDMDAYMIDWGIVADDLNDWKNNIIGGSLSQISSCWTAFKEWVSSLFESNSGGVITGLQIIDLLKTPFSNINSISPTELSTFNVKYAMYFVNSNGVFCCLFNENYNFSVTSTGFYFQPLQGAKQYYSGYYPSTSTSVDFRSEQGGRGGSFSDSSQYYLYGVTVPSSANCHLWDFLGSNDDLNSNVYNPAIVPYIDLAPSDSRDAAIPDVMPLPWDNLGDTDDEAKDKIAGVIDGVNTGELSPADAMQKILDWINALAIDTSTDDTLVPENPEKPDETYPDRVQENQDNFGFTLAGFEKLFPFCIPFDIYAFMTLLVADPVAPVIQYPIYNPVTNQDEIIRIDFSAWESVVHLFRYIFDFLFIIGLLLVARSLIGGGDKS